MKKPKVKADLCLGCGTCAALAPKSFKLNSQGKSVPIDPAGDEEKTIQAAIDACPASAIGWQEDK
jgi:ferredoxin